MRGLWSVPTLKFGFLSVNILVDSSAKSIARASPSTGAYLNLLSLLNLLPARTSHQWSGPQYGASFMLQLQCFCSKMNPTPVLLQSTTSIVSHSVSKAFASSFTASTITLRDFRNSSYRW